jgi:hypothetical protein
MQNVEYVWVSLREETCTFPSFQKEEIKPRRDREKMAGDREEGTVGITKR